LTPQNEPFSHFYIGEIFNGMAWSAEEERDWVVQYLSPTLKNNNFGHIKIFSADENRVVFPNWAKTTFAKEKARNIFSGIAIHFYFDQQIGPEVLDEMKRLFPEKSLIYTEACAGVLQG